MFIHEDKVLSRELMCRKVQCKGQIKESSEKNYKEILSFFCLVGCYGGSSKVIELDVVHVMLRNIWTANYFP